MDPQLTHFRLTLTAALEVSEPDAVQAAALDDLDSVEFVDIGDGSADASRSEARSSIEESTAGAISWLIDADNLVEGIPGVEVDEFSVDVVELGRDGGQEVPTPDFARLFETCVCGRDDCHRCSGWQLTPRTAAVLWHVAQVRADRAYDDVLERGDDPVRDPDDWAVFGEYPRITWNVDAVWRRQAARAFDDLTDDLSNGEWPEPRCFGEEMALHLVLDDAEVAVEDDWFGAASGIEELPTHPDDYDWLMATDVLFQDTDILTLTDPSHDGIEEPDSDENRRYGIGDMRPPAWFTPFDNVEPRDGRRPFRR